MGVEKVKLQLLICANREWVELFTGCWITLVILGTLQCWGLNLSLKTPIS